LCRRHVAAGRNVHARGQGLQRFVGDGNDAGQGCGEAALGQRQIDTFAFRRTHDTAFVPGLHRIVRDAIRHCQTGRVMAGADEPQIQSAPDGSADFERSFPATLARHRNDKKRARLEEAGSEESSRGGGGRN